jgi:hypothetical protein
MEWFKHPTGSHNDLDFSEAWDQFGDAAPTVFWTVLEIYGEEFSHLNDGWLTVSLGFFERNLRRKWKKSEGILKFFENRGRIFFKKTDKSVSINIPKFIDYSSNWTKRQKPKPTEAPTEVTLEAPTEAPTAIEEEVEEERKKNKESKKKHLDSVLLTEKEFSKLQEVLGQKNLENGIEQLDYSITVKGGKYKDHYKALLSWFRRGFIKGAERPAKRMLRAPDVPDADKEAEQILAKLGGGNENLD